MGRIVEIMRQYFKRVLEANEHEVDPIEWTDTKYNHQN